MKHTIDNYVSKAKLNKEIVRKCAALAVLLSIMIITGVFWALKLEAITLAGEACCGKTEHTHTETCYAEESLCQLEEHIHDASCYSDLLADVETAEVWESTLADITYTEDKAQNLAAIAQSQVGYTESSLNYEVDDTGTTRGYSRYGAWYGNPYGEWSVMFVDFCLHYAGITDQEVPYNSGAEAMRLAWEQEGCYQVHEASIPEPGDILFLDTDGDNKADAAGILTQVLGDRYSVVLGDYEDAVQELLLTMEDITILGWGVLDTALSEGEPPEDTVADGGIVDNLQPEEAEEPVQDTGPVNLTVTPEEQSRIDAVLAAIEDLPTYEEVGATLAQYEAAGDTVGYTDYYNQIAEASYHAYLRWQDLGELQVMVLSSEQLMQYSGMWTVNTAAMAAPTIKQINNHQQNVSYIVAGTGTIRSKMGTGWSYTYWDAYVVSRNAYGYYVSSINKNNVSKLDIALPEGGFVYLAIDGDSWNVSVGERVSLNLNSEMDITQSHGYRAGGYGSISNVYETDSDNKLPTVASASTIDFVEVNLYNYGTNINHLWNSNHVYPGFQQNNGTTSINVNNNLGRYSLNFGDNITVDLAAGATNVTNQGGAINATANGANTPIQGAMNYNLVDGYPELSEAKISLKYLFSDGTYAKKQNTKNIDGLFQYDASTGKYYFDSRLNHAQFNAATNRFELYEQIITPNYIMYPFGNFLPFNDINKQATQASVIGKDYFQAVSESAKTKYDINTAKSEYSRLSTVLSNFVTRMNTEVGANWTGYDALKKYFALNSLDSSKVEDVTFPTEQLSRLYNINYDEATDFFFGMDMHMELMMPKDGTTGPNGDQTMEFKFIGDDDVWVYVDGKLFLDLSGIHRHVGGKIDFEKGIVEYYQFNPETGLADDVIHTIEFAKLLGTDANLNEKGTFKDYTTHSFDFYYMERGAGSSVNKIEFNFPLLQKNSISVTKELDAEEDLSVLGNPDFYFQILRDDKVTPLVDEGVTYDIMDAVSHTKIGTGTTGANGVFTLKENQTAVFPGILEDAGWYYVRELLDKSVYEQYGSITVDGKATVRDHYTEMEVENNSFVGVDSPLKNISDGSTAFAFTNHIDISKYGALTIKKEYKDYQSDLAPKDVSVEISFAEIPLPVGTKYQVTLADQSVVERTVTEAGKITFKSDETVFLPKIIAGTQVMVRETLASSRGYIVTYNASDNLNMEMLSDTSGDYGQGTIPSGKAEILIENDREGTKLSIPISKTLLYPDGTEYDYSFRLQQITGLTDGTPLERYIKASVTMVEEPQDMIFTLNYPPGMPEGTYYYRLYEEGAAAGNGMDIDQYLIAVTLQTDGGSSTADITGRYRITGVQEQDGKEVLQSTPIEGQENISFTNQNVRSLTIKKTVGGVEAPNTAFTFRIHASVEGSPIEGIYHYRAPDGRIGELLFTEGRAELQIRHGETYTITDLPYNAQWAVTEEAVGGFLTEYSLDKGEFVAGTEASGVLTQDSEVHYHNIGGYELPSTGGPGVSGNLFTGIGIMLLAVVGGILLRSRGERRLLSSSLRK